MTAFIAGEPLNPVQHRDVIIQRQELNEILDHIQTSDNYIVLKSSHQTGKTTLLWQIQYHLYENGYGVAYINFSLLENQNEADFYRYLCELIKLNLNDLIEASSDATLDLGNVIDFRGFSDFLKSLSSQAPKAQKVILMFR